MNKMICPYCKMTVTPSRPSPTYRCGNCGRVFRAPLCNPVGVALSAGDWWAAELKELISSGLAIPQRFIAEIEARIGMRFRA